MPIPPLLDELLRARGASGHEDAVQAIVRREARAVGAEIETDVLGSTVATVRGTTGRLVALFAHADQVGLVVQDATAEGLLKVAASATWSPAEAHRQRVCITTTRGEVAGVLFAASGKDNPDWKAARIDVGAASRDEALEVVRPGDPVVLDAPPQELRNGRIASGALDDRAGIFACLEVLKRAAAAPAAWDVAVVVSAQEEASWYPGAVTVANRIRPEVAVAVDVTYAGDAPGSAAWGDVRLGGGPTLLRAPLIHPAVVEGLSQAAASLGQPGVFEAGKRSWSDLDGVHRIGGGVACGMVSIPLRYMHSAAEVAQLSDIEDTARLIDAYVRSLTADASFLR
jgi:putative aminopeptidase FrvX